MKRIKSLRILSIIALAIFGILAGGSMDSGSNNSGSPSSSTASSAPPPSEKETVMSSVTLDFSWGIEDDDIMIANFKLTNPTDHAFKDFEITCDHSASSGTVIDHNVRTIYQIAGPKSTKSIRNFNMGFIDTQATNSSCRVTDLVVLD